MAIQKPSKPDVTLPSNFGGTKTPYTDSQISNGYQEAVPQVVDGGNINYEKDAVFKYLKYLKTATDALVNMPIGKILTVDSNNRFEYANPTVIANDSEYEEGALATKSPSVKQVRDSFADLDGRITNCIAKIPQDIKLSYENGTVKLGVGKVYDGAGNVININSEISKAITPDVQLMLYTNKSGTDILYTAATFQAFSGDTPPTTTQTTYCWYDTAEKRVKLYTNSTYKQDLSLPIGLLETDGTITVFNLWGKISDAIFINPGIEFLFANGFNSNGSYNSLKLTTSKLIVRELTQAEKNLGIVHVVCYRADAFGFGMGYKVVKNSSERKSQSAGGASYYYVEDENLTYVFDRTINEKFVYLGYIDVPNNELYIRRTIKLPNEQDVPKLEADNTFTGINTFTQPIIADTDSVNFIAKNSNIEKGVTPSSNLYCGYDFRGKDDARLVWLGVEYTSGYKLVSLQKHDTNLTRFALDHWKVTSQTPPTTDNSTQLATTAFVNNFITNLSSTVGSGYVYIGNLLICWGTWVNGENIFPRPFANTNYGIANIGEYSFDALDNSISAISTTGFTAQKKSNKITKYIAIGQRG